MTRKFLTSFGLTLLASGLVAAQMLASPQQPETADPPPTAAAPADAPQPPDPPQFAAGGGGASVTRRADGTVLIRRRRMFMGGDRMDMMGSQDMGMRGPERMWWMNSGLAKQLGLTDDQVAKIKKIFLDHRLQLIDLHADLEKQEVLLRPLIDADHPDENAVLAQIDKVAEARANLEKSNARMLFAIRDTLTPEQWQKLRDIRSERHRPQPTGRRMYRGQQGRPGRMMMRGGGQTGGPQAPPATPPSPDSQGGDGPQQP
jgi:Spy/CpxP family protein refolding chaperone